MSIRTTGVTELVLESRDLAASERFYAGALGLPVILRWEPPEWTRPEAFWVQAGDQTRIGLWQPQIGIAGGRPGLHVHFALTVAEEDYDAMVRQLRDHGEVVEEWIFGDDPQAPGQRSAYVEDPDGHVVELWTRDITTQTDGGAPRHVRTA